MARCCSDDAMVEGVVEYGGYGCGRSMRKRGRRQGGFVKVMQCWRGGDRVQYELCIASEIRHLS